MLMRPNDEDNKLFYDEIDKARIEKEARIGGFLLGVVATAVVVVILISAFPV